MGENVKQNKKFKKGDEVFLVPFRTNLPYGAPEEMSQSYSVLGEHLDGTMAEKVAAPSEFVMHKPACLSWEETAAFPLTFLTAYHMLTKKVQISEETKVLIWGANSGVGSAAIQIAKSYGAFVFTTVSSATKAEFAEQLAADVIINYKKERVSEKVLDLTKGEGVDYVIEHVGEQSWHQSIRALKRGGTIVTCGATSGAVVRIDLRHLFIKHQKIIGSTMGNRQDLAEICYLIDQKKIKPMISDVFSYKKIQDAHDVLEKGQQKGKIIIRF
jgi:NADPH:quinone reductase-like Zn-dependent oxidoreductase